MLIFSLGDLIKLEIIPSLNMSNRRTQLEYLFHPYIIDAGIDAKDLVTQPILTGKLIVYVMVLLSSGSRSAETFTSKVMVVSFQKQNRLYII